MGIKEELGTLSHTRDHAVAMRVGSDIKTLSTGTREVSLPPAW